MEPSEFTTWANGVTLSLNTLVNVTQQILALVTPGEASPGPGPIEQALDQLAMQVGAVHMEVREVGAKVDGVSGQVAGLRQDRFPY